MSVDNHLGLPEEVFEMILLLLALEDVLSCSLVCLGWRNAVNSNRIWEKLCKKNISEERLKLQAERKRVGSSYEVFESENMPMLCVWRRRYMDEVNLKRNWKHGCCREDFISSNSFPLDWMATDNELFLMTDSSDPLYTVFNIVDKPIMTGEIHPALRDRPELLKFSNNILVIVQRTLLQVYVKHEDKNLKLKFFALFDRDHSETIPDTPDLTNWYERIGYPGNLNIKCDHNGKYFVGMCTRHDAGVLLCSPLHIWDLESQTNIQEVALPMLIPGEQLKRASFNLRDNTIHIILIYQSCTSIYAYDIDKSSYSETVLQLEGDSESIILTGTVAIMESLSEGKLFLFDLRDGRMLDTLTIMRRSVSRRVRAFGNLITVDAEGGDPSTVTVYDTEKLRVVDKFQVVSNYDVYVVMDDLLIIFTRGQLHIRDMKTREILRTVHCYDFLPLDPSCSKMVVRNPRNKLVVLHFW